ncbi:MAG: hypothetical protein H0W76_12270 [Pyrinomonadaceae bacterium]|nr:hypothetical protein [Pyrinomonadaceae bacterium]
MDIESIRDRVRDGNYLIKSHAVQHALKEGFERKQMVESVLEGIIIEEYLDDQRVLICEYADPVYVEFVTALYP